MTQPANLLILFSDEHNPKVLGAAGHPFIHTPHLDGLARRGTRFARAYTPHPICVPARAALAAGRYNFEIGYWDNADPYEGAVRSWHHAAREAGHAVVSIGKLHFRGLPGDDHGFSEEIIPMHVVQGKGDLLGLLRRPEMPVRGGAQKLIGMAGPGESDYTRYDRDICARAQVWLRETAPKLRDKPWVLFVSLVAPHFPLTAPPEHFYRYPPERIPMPKAYGEQRPRHPYVEEYARTIPYNDHFRSEADVKRALAGYFGLVSLMDEHVGKILKALDDTGLAANTRVLYTTDHGDNNGARRLWGKSTMYEESVGVPMILAGPGVAAGRVVNTPANLIDLYPTVLEAVGAKPEPLPHARSLFGLAAAPDHDREVLAEYHATGSSAAFFMLRTGRWKYVEHVRFPPQLFDMEADPEELNDLAGDPGHAQVLAECAAKLRRYCDPKEVDARAKARQQATLAANGGEQAVIKRGDLPFSPPPGVAAAWS